jgi:hypothetical protein
MKDIIVHVVKQKVTYVSMEHTVSSFGLVSEVQGSTFLLNVGQFIQNTHRPTLEDKYSFLFVMYLLTELSPSWGTADCAAIQELPSTSWNPKVQYRVHKRPPLVPILSHINPIHTIPSYLSKIHFNIVHPSTSWLFQSALSLWLSHQYPICILLLHHSC